MWFLWVYGGLLVQNINHYSFPCQFLGVFQQFLMIWALQLESAASVSVLRQCRIILAYIIQVWSSLGCSGQIWRMFYFQVVAFGEMPQWSDLVGAVLIIVTIVSMTFEKKITSLACRKNEEPETKQDTPSFLDAVRCKLQHLYNKLCISVQSYISLDWKFNI